ncbi:MAG: hypothetical protein GQ477_06050 [Nanohaloarchaea archaeon]|nr:hypothetical protein [Candidatus Nanohaloarchaea archaeon]
MQELISEKLSSLPDISNKDYKVEEFIINNLKDIKQLRYGCVYKNGDSRFLLFKEENAEVSELEFLETRKFNNIQIYYGYNLTFLLAKNMIEMSRNYISWIEDKNIFTLIQTQNNVEQNILSLNDMLQNDKLMNIFNIIIKTKTCFGKLACFKIIENIPNEMQVFKLITTYILFSHTSKDPKDIIVILKGNFVHEKQKKVFVNIEMGFSYAFSEKFEEFSKNFKKQKEIYESKKQDKTIEYSYIDPDKKFYIRCGNNETSCEFKDRILNIMTEIVENMKEYSCIEETLIFSQSRS